jgi:Putative addiction module component
MTKAVQLLSEALELPDADRALLARELALSLEDEFDPDAKELWAREILKRSDTLHRGRAKTRDAFQAVERIRRTLPRQATR